MRLTYVSRSQVRLRDLLTMRDRDRWVGWRVAGFLAREALRDLFSIRGKSGFKDWLKFATAMLGAISGLGSLSWLLAQLLGWLR